MIIASLADSARYEKLNPLFRQAFDFVRAADPAVLEPGLHVLVEGALIVMVNETAMKAPEKARMEVHNKFIDIHVPLSRDERFTWKERAALGKTVRTLPGREGCAALRRRGRNFLHRQARPVRRVFPGRRPCRVHWGRRHPQAGD